MYRVALLGATVLPTIDSMEDWYGATVLPRTVTLGWIDRSKALELEQSTT